MHSHSDHSSERTTGSFFRLGAFFIFLLLTLSGIVLSLQIEKTAKQDVVPPESQAEETYLKGTITRVVSEEEVEGFGETLFRQTMEVRVSEDGIKTPRVLDYEIAYGQKDIRSLSEGDRVVIAKVVYPDQEEPEYYISDTYRLNTLWLIVGILFVLVIAFARQYGVRAFVGLALSFAVIMGIVVPLILAGKNPLLVSFVGTILIASAGLYIAHGVKARTTIAFTSTLITIAIALLLSWVFVKMAHLFGMGSEEAFYLQFIPGGGINIQGLLLGGIVIGTLGVLDDITTAQAAAVEEIYNANPTFGYAELYRRGSSVGREHIVSLVNTLVLAYTGAALPLLLLFRVYERPWWVTLNGEIIMEEVIRMLVGSIALVLAVPITTFLAARYFSQREKETER